MIRPDSKVQRGKLINFFSKVFDHSVAIPQRPNILLITICCFIISAQLSPAFSQEAIFTQEELTLEFYPTKDDDQYPVKVEFQGNYYPEGDKIYGDNGIVPALRDTSLIVARLIRAYAAGSLDDVLQLWAPEERDSQRKRLEKSFEWNQKIHRSLQSSEVRIEIFYGSFRIVTARHLLKDGQVIVSTYPLVKQGDRYFMTYSLAKDIVYQTLYLKLREKLSEQAIEQSIITAIGAAETSEDATEDGPKAAS